MYLTRRISKYPLEYTRRKRKKRHWFLIFLVSAFAACDVLILYVLFKIFLPLLLESTPYLLPEHAQEYAHISTFSTPRKPVTTLAFTPDGKTLACTAYSEIILWDVKTGDPLYTMNEHAGIVTDLTFSPDGKTFAISKKSNQHPVILHDTTTGQVKASLSGHTSWIATLDFSPDGATLVGANSDGLITTWDTITGLTHQRILGTFAFARLAHLYGHGYYDYSRERIITRWNWVVKDQNVDNTPENLNSILNSEVFNDKGIIALTPGPNLLPIYLSSHSYPIQALAFSPDGRILTSSSRSEFQPFNITAGKIHLWDVETGMPKITLRTPRWKVDTLAFSPDGKYLASDGSKRWADSRKILVWDLTTQRLMSMIDTDSPCEITALAFAPDNIMLASGDECGEVDLWDITGQIRE
ncbi:PD40 domain-containing protein [Candidatus Poribacteria bacterium]|nr:PD40 domain-containing protein [Candidatus Poribacteria bacterium]